MAQEKTHGGTTGLIPVAPFDIVFKFKQI